MRRCSNGGLVLRRCSSYGCLVLGGSMQWRLGLLRRRVGGRHSSSLWCIHRITATATPRVGLLRSRGIGLRRRRHRSRKGRHIARRYRCCSKARNAASLLFGSKDRGRRGGRHSGSDNVNVSASSHDRPTIGVRAIGALGCVWDGRMRRRRSATWSGSGGIHGTRVLYNESINVWIVLQRLRVVRSDPFSHAPYTL